MARRKAGRDIETYAHTDKERVNNPPVGLVTPETDRDAGRRTYAHDPHLDPYLSWAGKAGQRISFARLEPLPGTRWLPAEGETRPDAAGADHVRESATADTPTSLVVSFGPDHAPLEQRQVTRAIEEAESLVPKPKIIVFAAFQFDLEAAKDIDETQWPGVTLLKAQMNADLLTGDLKKKRASNESFWLIGQPDVGVKRIAEGEGKFLISVQGFDYFNTKTGNVESGGSNRIALWMLDPDYDGRSWPAISGPRSTKAGWKPIAAPSRCPSRRGSMDERP